jgi:ParB family chromosome partitioning protein
LRVLLRAIVNLDPYTFADDLADDVAGENENDQRTAEEVLLSTIDSLIDDGLTGFTVRLALSGHRGIPREGEFDFLAEADQIFALPLTQEGEKQRTRRSPPQSKLPPSQFRRLQ